jgi:HAD superfamily hydrolase (TIGR01509 family)
MIEKVPDIAAFQLIIFDCDGVLLNTEEIMLDIDLQFLGRIGLHYERDKYIERFLGTKEKYHFEELDRDHREKFGAPLPENFEHEINTAAGREYEKRLQALPGIAEFLSRSTAKRCVASSSIRAVLERNLKFTELYDYFSPHIFSGDMVEHGKPAPDLFLHAAGTMNENPQDCIVIEDSVNGVKAARAAGMTVVGFIGGKHCGLAHREKLQREGAIKVINTLYDLQKTLNAL